MKKVSVIEVDSNNFFEAAGPGGLAFLGAITAIPLIIALIPIIWLRIILAALSMAGFVYMVWYGWNDFKTVSPGSCVNEEIFGCKPIKCHNPKKDGGFDDLDFPNSRT